MCRTPKMPAPQAPTKYAAAKAPTQQDTADAGQRMTDQLRAQSTILTGPMGVTMASETGKKTLLGQ
jgi:hypothetical protein